MWNLILDLLWVRLYTIYIFILILLQCIAISQHESAVRKAYINKRYEKVLRLLSITPHQSVEAAVIELVILSNSVHSHLVRTHPLHLSAYYGWIDIVRLLISNGYSPTKRDAHDKVPLYYAAMGGHHGIVTYFTWYNNAYGDHYDAMYGAAKGGHLKVVKYFVEQCNVHGDYYGVMCAAARGDHLDVVEYLINKLGVHRAMRDATKGGHLDVVKYLVEKCNIYVCCAADAGYYEVMCDAVKGGHLDMVKYFIEKLNEVDVHHTLHYVAREGHLDVLKCLIQGCNVDPHTLDSSRNTLLHSLAKCTTTSYKVVEYLVDVCHCDPMAINNDGDTPILIALQAMNLKVVQCLLKDSKSHPNKYNYLPVHAAVKNNDVPWLKCLIYDEHHDPMCIDGYDGRTPLHVACKHGHLTVVKDLLSLPSVNPMCIDKNGNTPLHIACVYGHLNVVEYLISLPSVDPMRIDKDSNTSLHIACKHGHLTVVKCLLSLPLVDPMSIDKYGNAPLNVAYNNVHPTVVNYLLSLPSVDLMHSDKSGNTLLHFACKRLHLTMVMYLLSFPSVLVNLMCINNDGDMPLDIICLQLDNDNGQYLAMELLSVHVQASIVHKNLLPCLINTFNKYGNVLLHVACKYSRLTIIKYLLSFPSVDSMYIDKYGKTPLHVACEHGHLTVVKYLLSLSSVDPMCIDKYGKMPINCIKSHDVDTVHQLYKVFDKVRESHSVASFVNILLLGDPGAGKTTFAQVIKERATNFFKFGTVKQANCKSPTAGIVPTTLQNTELGNIILHDFAGQPQYYSSHTAVLENILKKTGAIFLLLVNLKNNIFKQIEFWESAILNECSKASSDCHLVVIGSHVDEVSKNDIEKKRKEFTQKEWNINVSTEHLYFLNCCKRSGSELNSIIHTLSDFCTSIRNKQWKRISLTCNFLYSLLKDGMSSNIHTIEEVTRACSEANDVHISITNADQVAEDEIASLLEALHSTGLIVYLHSHTGSWVVVNKQILIAELNGILFAPKDFPEHCDIASNTGIVTTTVLKELFPHYPVDMIIAFLEHMKLCHEFDQSLLDNTNLSIYSEDQLIPTTEELLFFPALIEEKCPPHINTTIYQIGWYLKRNTTHFFHNSFPSSSIVRTCLSICPPCS